MAATLSYRYSAGQRIFWCRYSARLKVARYSP